MTAKKKTFTVTQTGSVSGAKPGMQENLAGLGLRRIGQTRVVEDTPSTRGMVNKVRHLVQVVEGK